VIRKLVIAGLIVGMPAMAGTASADNLNKMCGKPATVTVYDPSGHPLASETVLEPDGFADPQGHCPSGDTVIGV